MPPPRLRFLFVLPVVLITSVTGCVGKKIAGRSNVVFILIDTLRADHLGVYGFPGPISPHLDELARESVLFERCLAPAPWTKPSVASMFTSLYPETHNVLYSKWPDPNFVEKVEVLSSEAITLAEMFQSAGYRTGAFMSNEWLKNPYGYSQGFDQYVFDPRSFDDPNRIARLAEAWVSSQTAASPYFLYVHLMQPHSPYEFDEKDFEDMKKSLGADRDGEMTRKQVDAVHDLAQATWKGRPQMAGRLLNWRAAYAAGVKRGDAVVGSLIDWFRQRGTLDNSIFIVAADHGEGLMDHGTLQHGNSLDIEVVQVPFMVRLPAGKSAGRRVKEWVSLIDILPTLAEMCGLSGPEKTWRGQSLVRAMAGKGLRKRPQFTSTPGQHAVVDGDYHLIHNAVHGNEKLFDLRADPGERHDLSVERGSVVRRLGAVLDEHMKNLQLAPRLGAASAPMTAEQIEALRSLGYLQ